MPDWLVCHAKPAQTHFLGIGIVYCIRVASKSSLFAPGSQIQTQKLLQLKKTLKWGEQQVLYSSGVTEGWGWRAPGTGEAGEAGLALQSPWHGGA